MLTRSRIRPLHIFTLTLTRVYYKFNTSLVRASLDHHLLNRCLSRAQLNRAELVTCSGRTDVSALRDIKITSTTYTLCYGLVKVVESVISLY